MKTNSISHLAVLVGLLTAAQMASAITRDNPYHTAITQRNMFGLKAPTAPPLTQSLSMAPLPKILLVGITTVMDGKKALLRVSQPAHPSGLAKEISLILSEGSPASEGVQVLEIDVAAGTVKIVNNGTIQILDIKTDAPKSTGAPVSAPGVPVPLLTTSNSKGAANRSSSEVARLEATQAPSVEEQTILMEVWRMQNADRVAAGEMPPLPPTDLTPILEQEQQQVP